eukprot:TRINITY_DN23465_c0_g1_i1.p1 TRINITY_DN23465_c0_g1~~TRINITY_DN23465_c0_g1_i1.p1  ORF type:complete len:493 (-),score=42.66 TRINITY_DN23465_c0_g1_i1:447-1925(-)
MTLLQVQRKNISAYFLKKISDYERALLTQLQRNDTDITKLCLLGAESSCGREGVHCLWPGKMGSNDFDKLVDAIRSNDKLVQLEWVNTRLSSQCEAITEALCDNRGVHTLICHTVDLGMSGHIARILSQNKTLRALAVSSVIEKFAQEELINALMQNTGLRSLKIISNKCESLGALEAIEASLVKALTKNTTLLSFEFKYREGAPNQVEFGFPGIQMLLARNRALMASHDNLVEFQFGGTITKTYNIENWLNHVGAGRDSYCLKFVRTFPSNVLVPDQFADEFFHVVSCLLRTDGPGISSVSRLPKIELQHDKLVEVRFEDPIARQSFQVEEWLKQIGMGKDVYSLTFVADRPFAVLVPHQYADHFMYVSSKALRTNAPKCSDISSCPTLGAQHDKLVEFRFEGLIASDKNFSIEEWLAGIEQIAALRELCNLQYVDDRHAVLVPHEYAEDFYDIVSKSVDANVLEGSTISRCPAIRIAPADELPSPNALIS